MSAEDDDRCFCSPLSLRVKSARRIESSFEGIPILDESRRLLKSEPLRLAQPRVSRSPSDMETTLAAEAQESDDSKEPRRLDEDLRPRPEARGVGA